MNVLPRHPDTAPNHLDDWRHLVTFAILTVLGISLCFLIAAPFLPAATWAVALAVVGLPLHRWLLKTLKRPNWAAGISTLVAVLATGVPVILVAIQMAAETTRAAESVQRESNSGHWREQVVRIPYVGERFANMNVAEMEGQVRSLVSQLGARSIGVIGGIAEAILQTLVALFILFFCFRDCHHLLDSVRRLLPLSTSAANKVIDRATDAIHATVYGTLLTAVIQGVSGGLLFWAVGLPIPAVWGFVMFVLGVLPFLGAFLVWVPAAVYLVSADRWGAAIALVVWGLTMAGPMCNYLYAVVAGDRLRLHPVPTLISFIGGLAVFGISGMVLGPCIWAVTIALIDFWSRPSLDTEASTTPSILTNHRLKAESPLA